MFLCVVFGLLCFAVDVFSCVYSLFQEIKYRVAQNSNPTYQ